MKKMAVIDYSKCNPKECEGGICKVVQECPKKLLRQEEPYEMPDIFPNMCVGCAQCITVCPLGAVKMV